MSKYRIYSGIEMNKKIYNYCTDKKEIQVCPIARTRQTLHIKKIVIQRKELAPGNI